MPEIRLTKYRLSCSGNEVIWMDKEGRILCHLRISNVERLLHLLGQFFKEMKETTLLQLPMPTEATPVLLSVLDVEQLLAGLKIWAQHSALKRQGAL